MTPAEDCIVPDNCINESAAVVACWTENATGCMCEEADPSMGVEADLNCEGTFKDNEGPAELGTPCLDVVAAFRACSPDEEEEVETSEDGSSDGSSDEQ